MVAKYYQKKAYLKEKVKILTIAKNIGLGKYKFISFLKKYRSLDKLIYFLSTDLECKW